MQVDSDLRVRISDKDVIDAYEYMLARWLVLRQEVRDLNHGFRWNELVHRPCDPADARDPDFDMIRSEAWIAIDERNCTLLELPRIIGRYYTAQLLNGWGEVIANINERTYPNHPHGRFALCLKGAGTPCPDAAQYVELPGRKARLVVRIEQGADLEGAIALQHKLVLHAYGAPSIADAPYRSDFASFPGVEAFDRTGEVLASEPDLNSGMVSLREKARAVAAALADPEERGRIDVVIREKAIPHFVDQIPQSGRLANGWVQPRAAGVYGADYLMRTIANCTDIWTNSGAELSWFRRAALDGSSVQTMTFPMGDQPEDHSQTWSLTALDNGTRCAIANPLDRFQRNRQSKLKPNPDGSLTLWMAPERPKKCPESNWLPTRAGAAYDLCFRLYGASAEAVRGTWLPPALVEQGGAI